MPSDASREPDKASTDLAYQVMNAIGQGLIVTSLEKGWRFEYVNPAFCQLVGRLLEALAGVQHALRCH
jgi:PAS domain-containing protein